MLTRRQFAGGHLAATAAGLAWQAQAQTQSSGRPRWAAVDEAMQDAYSGKVCPGAVVVIARGDELVYSRAVGSANLETDSPMTIGSVCRIGSTTKQFTAAAVLLLAQDGKLSLDDPLAKLVPEFPGADRLPLRRILNHTSGVGNYTAVKSLAVFLQSSRLDYDEAALLEAMKATNPLFLFEPGTDWRYSNTGYVLLGIVIARASGQPYAQFLRSRLFEPLSLEDTAVDDASDVVRRRASGYTPDKAAPTGFRNASFISMTYPGGAGSIRSTGPDLCRWSAALLGGRVLKPESLAAMLTPARLNDGSLPAPPKGAPAGAPGTRYGFGLDLSPDRGHRRVWHLGGIQGFFSELRSYPDLGLHIAILVNSDGTGGATPSAAISAAVTNVLLNGAR